MAAPIGNKFWEIRKKHGRNPIFSSADELWEKACEYFDWCYENPLMETKLFSYEGEIVEGEAPKMRAMTIQALCFYLGISDEAWANYCKREDFIGICSDIKKVIYTQKFEGASAGFLNASIIAREIGLSNSDSNAPSNEKEAIELEIKRLELEKIKREVNPPAINAPDKDYVVLKPDEDIPSEPIL